MREEQKGAVGLGLSRPSPGRRLGKLIAIDLHVGVTRCQSSTPQATTFVVCSICMSVVVEMRAASVAQTEAHVGMHRVHPSHAGED